MYIRSFNPIIDDNSCVLILGSMPGKISLEKGQYYAHSQNKFWALIYAIFELRPNGTYEEKISFLKAKKIALWDVIKQCERSGSADSKITNPMINDLGGLLLQNPNIKYILFNGKIAEQLFKKNINNIIRRKITLFRLPSSSPANASISLNKKLEAWSIIRDLTND